jgi:ABC-type multidrug transport system ATPase subunit
MRKIQLKVKDLIVKYGEKFAVNSLSFELNNETVVFFGPSGCGKTSILKAILSVSEPNMKITGTILLDEMPIKKGSGEVGMTFQGPVIPPWMTVFDLCRM